MCYKPLPPIEIAIVKGRQVVWLKRRGEKGYRPNDPRPIWILMGAFLMWSLGVEFTGFSPAQLVILKFLALSLAGVVLWRSMSWICRFLRSG